MKPVLLASLAILGSVTVAAAQTPAMSPADTIRMRQANYKQMAGAMHGLLEQVKGGSPSVPEIRRHSAVILRFAPQVLQWFPAGSGPEAGVRTRAKPEIWTDRRGFRTAGARLLVAARRLDSAARSGDLARINAAVPALAASCGGCHDGYRGPAN